MTLSMVLAGCMDLTDEDVESIVDSIIEIPGCNDETAYNYDENATNNLACLTEIALVSSVSAFVKLVDEGPEWGETGAMIQQGSSNMEGQTTSFTQIIAMSPDGMYSYTEMNQGMISMKIGQAMLQADDGTALMQVNWMGEEFLMASETPFGEAWNEVVFNEEFKSDDADEEDHSDDMSDEMVCYDMNTHTVLMEIDNQADCENDGYMWVPANSGPDSDGGHDGDHGDDMDDMDDMGDDMFGDMSVEIPDSFDPATAAYELGLATDNGFSFTTSMDDGMGTDVTMTFMLDDSFRVTKMIMTTSMDGESSTSSIEVLYDEDASSYFEADETLGYQALPFTLTPMGGDDHGDHDGHDHGDHDGEDDGHDGHDHGDEITSLEDFDVSSWDSTNDLQQIVDWFNDNYMYEEDETLMQVGDFLSLCDADPDYVDNYVAECVFNSAMNMLHNDDHDDEEMVCYDMNSHSVMMEYDNEADCENAGYMWTSADGDGDDHGEMSIEDIMMAIDDGDGLVSWTEFESYILNQDGGWTDDADRSNTYEAFNASDMDDDGYLDADEFEAMFYAMNGDDDDGPMFTCANGDEIPLSFVNDGMGDCDGSDEPQYDSEGNEISSFTCMDGSQIMISQVNDGNEDCLDGDDEASSMDDDHDHDDHEEMIYDCLYIVAIDSVTNDANGQPDYTSSWDGTNLDTSLCETIVENPDDYMIEEEGSLGIPTQFYAWEIEDGEEMVMMVDISNNPIELTTYVSSQDECDSLVSTYNSDEGTCTMQTDMEVTANDESMMYWYSAEDDIEVAVLYQYDATTGSGVLMGLTPVDDDDDDDDDETPNFYDGCTQTTDSADSYWECYMNEWLDSDGDIMMSDGYEMEECSQLEDGSGWECLRHDDHGDHDDHDHYVFYCSNDGEEYANSMGGILCPDGAGVVPTCPDGQPCVCIDVDGSCDDGDDDWGYENHDHDHDDHDDHMMAYDWMIGSSMDLGLDGSYDDYSIVLALCTMDESSDSDDMMMMGDSPTMSCGDDVMTVSLAEATAPGADVMFHDADMSGTITEGDMIHINPDIDAGGEWNTVRLYSASADSYSDENPMLTPGFGAVAGIIALLGAALLTRRD